MHSNTSLREHVWDAHCKGCSARLGGRGSISSSTLCEIFWTLAIFFLMYLIAFLMSWLSGLAERPSKWKPKSSVCMLMGDRHKLEGLWERTPLMYSCCAMCMCWGGGRQVVFWSILLYWSEQPCGCSYGLCPLHIIWIYASIPTGESGCSKLYLHSYSMVQIMRVEKTYFQFLMKQ